MGSSILGKSVLKSQQNVAEFHGAWKVVTLSPVCLMNVGQRQTSADPQSKSTDLSHITNPVVRIFKKKLTCQGG